MSQKYEKLKTLLRELFQLDQPVLPPSSVGKMTLRLYSALSYSQNSARDLRCALNGA